MLNVFPAPDVSVFVVQAVLELINQSIIGNIGNQNYVIKPPEEGGGGGMNSILFLLRFCLNDMDRMINSFHMMKDSSHVTEEKETSTNKRDFYGM